MKKVSPLGSVTVYNNGVCTGMDVVRLADVGNVDANCGAPDAAERVS